METVVILHHAGKPIDPLITSLGSSSNSGNSQTFCLSKLGTSQRDFFHLSYIKEDDHARQLSNHTLSNCTARDINTSINLFIFCLSRELHCTMLGPGESDFGMEFYV